MTYFVRRNDYLTTAQASKFLNVTRFTVLNWIKDGKLQSVSTAGGHQRIPKGVVLSAMRQIKSVEPIKPLKPELPITTAFVHCWESKEIKQSRCDHDCANCLVFKNKLNLCFMAVGQFGVFKRECSKDCLNCAYLAKYHPQEKKTMQRMQQKAAAQARSEKVQDSRVSVNGILKKVFYKSGRLVAKIGQLSKGQEFKKQYKRSTKNVRKG